MFSIGEFSKVVGLSVKTLRFYHERGLLVPALVDPQTGYRYYDPSQAEKARILGQLRALEFSLDEIASILENRGEMDRIDGLERHKSQLEVNIRRQRAIVASLEHIIRHEREARNTMQNATFEVEEKVLEPLLMAGIRMRGKYSDCGKGFARIGRGLGRYLNGKCFLLHHDTEFHDGDADFEACFPVSKAKEVPGIVIRELPGGKCVTLLHKGPYEELGRSYAKIMAYNKARGYEVLLPTREVYVKGPGMIFRGNPKNYLTEIQMLVVEGDKRPEPIAHARDA